MRYIMSSLACPALQYLYKECLKRPDFGGGGGLTQYELNGTLPEEQCALAISLFPLEGIPENLKHLPPTHQEMQILRSIYE
jgi:hypothetical protein